MIQLTCEQTGLTYYSSIQKWLSIELTEPSWTVQTNMLYKHTKTGLPRKAESYPSYVCCVHLFPLFNILTNIVVINILTNIVVINILTNIVGINILTNIVVINILTNICFFLLCELNVFPTNNSVFLQYSSSRHLWLCNYVGKFIDLLLGSTKLYFSVAREY